MKYKPFLCHKREKGRTVAYLKEQLCIRGAGGWKDTDDIPKGVEFLDDVVDAIENDTGGFIWWATKDTLESGTICETELPTALDRAKNDPTYPVLPVFVELRPGRDSAAIKAAVGDTYGAQMLGANGVVRRSRQSVKALAHETARAYVKQLVELVPPGPVDVEVTAFRAPTQQHHLTLDWRTLFDPLKRELAPDALGTIVEALGDIREALQTRDRAPQVTVEVALPLPLAMLLGYEWRTTTAVQVTVQTVSPGGSLLKVFAGSPTKRGWPAAQAQRMAGSGPLVVAVSVGTTLGSTVSRYAHDVSARGFEHLHVDCPPTGLLSPDDVQALGCHVADRLKALQADGQPKHLLLKTPATVAVALGLAANASGPTWVPFYDGHDYYIGGIWIG
jgi:hypothetical protein